MSQDKQKNTVFNDTNIADDRQQEQVLRGIQPKNQWAYKIFKGLRMIGLLFLGLAILMFASTFVPQFSGFTSNPTFRYAILGLVGGGIICLFLMITIKLLFLRKCPFDDWVFEVAQRDLGTDLIFYTSKCLYIKYDVASSKEVDKRDFVTKMSDLSIHYSYFYVNTFVDQQVIQVECTKKQPIPQRAVLEPDDDLFSGIIPVGLTINNTSQKVSPIAWVLNDKNKNPNLLETMPSVSFLISGGTGCFKTDEVVVMYNNLIMCDEK